MPITRKQFEMGTDDEIEKYKKMICDFLIQHKEEAYTAKELADACCGAIRFPDQSKAIDDAVKKLMELDSVEYRKIHDTYYYSYKASD